MLASCSSHSSLSSDYTAFGGDAMRLFAAAGARHGVKITKVMYLFRPLMKEYKYSIHAVWDRDFWRQQIQHGSVHLAKQEYYHSLSNNLSAEHQAELLEVAEALERQDVSQFREGKEQNPLTYLKFLGSTTRQNLHTAIYVELGDEGKMVLEFNTEGITVSIDTEIKRAATDRRINFASAGIDFDVPPGHQLSTYQLVQRYLVQSSMLQYNLLTWNCQCWSQELYCNIVRGTEYTCNMEVSVAFFRWKLCERWKVRCPYPDARVFEHGRQIEPDAASASAPAPVAPAPAAAGPSCSTTGSAASLLPAGGGNAGGGDADQVALALQREDAVNMLLSYMSEDLARQRVDDELARLDPELTAEERRVQINHIIWRLHSEFEPIVPMAARRTKRQVKPRLLVLDYAFDRRYQRALWDEFNVECCVLPDFRNLSAVELASEEEKLRLAITQHSCENGSYREAEVVVCASYGGYYMVHLWQLMQAKPDEFSRLPCLMINAYPSLMPADFTLPEDVPIVIAHGLLDDQFKWEWGLDKFGNIESASGRHSLSSIVRTGTPGYVFLYHTGLGITRRADGHYCRSLGRDMLGGAGERTLPRLVESLMTSSYSQFTPFRPEARFLVSSSAFTKDVRVQAEISLGYHPVVLQRFWPSAQQLPLRMDVEHGSAEWKDVRAIFHAEPEVPRYYDNRSTKNMRVEQIERVQNPHLLHHSILSHNSIRTNLLEGGIVLEGGTHVRYLWHGTSSYDVLGRMVADPLQAFNVALAGASVGARWGRGSYFARDAAYSVPFSTGCVDEQGRQVLLLCLVEVGLSTVGSPDLYNLPARTEPGQRYHSFVDSASNPEIFVVQTPSQVYPAYIVHFRPR